MKLEAVMSHQPPEVPSEAGGTTEAVTRGDVRLQIRPASLDDLDLLADLYSHLTDQDMRFRFKGAVTQLSADDLSDLVRREAGMTSYIAFSGARAIACATLMHDPGRKSAEVVLCVLPDWKGRGVSWTLLQDVMARAAAAGLKRISSTELGEDREAINLQREMGFVARLQSADPVKLSMVKTLNGSEGPSPPANWQQE